MKKGDILTLKIESTAFGSEGLARYDGRVIFVSGAVPGERVEVQIVKKRRDYAKAKVVSFIHRSQHRQNAPCGHFPVCGGCKLQDISYPYQLEMKREIVAETLSRLSGIKAVQIRPTLPSPDIFGYRNKMEFSFSAQRWILTEETDPLQKPKDFALGLHVPRRYDKVLDIDNCRLQADPANGILNSVKKFAFDSRKPAWNAHNNTGFWRFLVIREGKNTGQIMVNIVTSEYDRLLIGKLSELLVKNYPDITAIVNNITTSVGGSAFGEKEYLLAGASFIEEKIGDFTFEISANSFFQTNTKQAEYLYNTVKEFADLSKKDIVYDLYSGTGTISIFLANLVKKVIGIEVIESAVENALRNTERNRIKNCEFILGDIREIFRDIDDLIGKYGVPDILILDPPRAGIHPKSLLGILALKPKRIVYVSCNPATFARDAKVLNDGDYNVIQVQPIDMFPHTHHIELVAQLDRKKLS